MSHQLFQCTLFFACDCEYVSCVISNTQSGVYSLDGQNSRGSPPTIVHKVRGTKNIDEAVVPVVSWVRKF